MNTLKSIIQYISFLFSRNEIIISIKTDLNNIFCGIFEIFLIASNFVGLRHFTAAWYLKIILYVYEKAERHSICFAESQPCLTGMKV